MVSDLIKLMRTVVSLAVLILVLMEYGLWQARKSTIVFVPPGLNPCSNGIWSLTPQSTPSTFIGKIVLILVLMEYGLWLIYCATIIFSSISLNPCSNGIWSLTLIGITKWKIKICLNPCSNGIWSLTSLTSHNSRYDRVLILVLMEYGLWQSTIAAY